MALFDQSTINLILSYFLPFLIIFIILYALLQKSKIFGGDSAGGRRLNAFLSAIIALLIVGVNPFGITWLAFFTNIFSGGIFLIIGVTFAVLFAIMIGAATGRKTGWITLLICVILAGVALNFSGIGQNLIPNFGGQGFDISQFTPYILVASIFAVLYGIWYMLGREPKATS
jgi:hypothetical protein